MKKKAWSDQDGQHCSEDCQKHNHHRVRHRETRHGTDFLDGRVLLTVGAQDAIRDAILLNTPALPNVTPPPKLASGYLLHSGNR
jgi:hypothetical protein